MKICTNEELYEVYVCVCVCVPGKVDRGETDVQRWISDVVIIAAVYSLEAPIMPIRSIRMGR